MQNTCHISADNGNHGTKDKSHQDGSDIRSSAGQKADQNHKHIIGDPDEMKRNPGHPVPDNGRGGIVWRKTHFGVHVKGCADNETKQGQCKNNCAGRLCGEYRLREKSAPEIAAEVGNVADQNHVGDGADTDHVPVSDENENQKYGVQKQLPVAKGQAEQTGNRQIHEGAGVSPQIDIDQEGQEETHAEHGSDDDDCFLFEVRCEILLNIHGNLFLFQYETFLLYTVFFIWYTGNHQIRHEVKSERLSIVYSPGLRRELHKPEFISRSLRSRHEDRLWFRKSICVQNRNQM